MQPLDILSASDESLPAYVRAAATREPKWEYVAPIPGCYQMLTAEQAQEIREIELLGA